MLIHYPKICGPLESVDSGVVRSWPLTRKPFTPPSESNLLNMRMYYATADQCIIVKDR